MAKAKRKTSKASVKKTWVPIVAPAIFQRKPIGETPVIEPSKSIGKQVPVNLMNLTGDMRQQNINVIFEITKVLEGKFQTELIGFKMAAGSIKRMVRRGKRKADYSFEVVTKDGFKLRLKVIMITIGMTNALPLTRLKKACKEEVDKYMGINTFDKFVSELVNHRFQGAMKKILSKTYPLRLFEIRFMQVMKKGVVEKPKPVEVKPAEAEKKTEVKEAPTEAKPAEAEKKAEMKPVEAKVEVKPIEAEVKEAPKKEKVEDAKTDN